MTQLINDVFPYAPETVDGIGCVVRFYSKTNITKFKVLLTQLNAVNFSAYVLVMDRTLITSGPIVSKEEQQLINVIRDVFNKTDTKNKNLHLLYSRNHYNGTGSFNVAFNFIRRVKEYKNYMWEFCDDDDDINIPEFNKLIHFITELRSNYIINPDHIVSRDGTNYYIKINYDNREHYFNLTTTENNIIKNPNDFKITTDLLIFHGSTTKTHLFEYAHKTDCNLWRFLFSPVYFHNLSCRLIPFGREDMDMINYLMCAITSEYYNGIYNKTLMNTRTDGEQFLIPHNLIRINALFTEPCESDKDKTTFHKIYSMGM